LAQNAIIVLLETTTCPPTGWVQSLEWSTELDYWTTSGDLRCIKDGDQQ